MVSVAVLLLSAAAAPASTSVAGLYQTHQIEIGGGLELRKDGRFRYSLEYGAVSEQAEGTWTFDGKTVRLTTKPMPKPPSFELVSDDPAPKGELFIKVDQQGFNWSGRLDAIATAPSGERGLVTTDETGRIDAGGRILSAIDPLVPVYGTVAGHFVLSPDRGHRLLFRFHANDLGKAAFRGEPLTIKGSALVLTRYDAEIRFLRDQP
jgi:hypothetical protein